MNGPVEATKEVLSQIDGNDGLEPRGSSEQINRAEYFLMLLWERGYLVAAIGDSDEALEAEAILGLQQ